MRTETENNIIDYMVRIGTRETTSGNFCFWYEELAEVFGLEVEEIEEAAEDIELGLNCHETVLAADIEEEDGQHFDIIFGLAYCHYIEELCEED